MSECPTKKSRAGVSFEPPPPAKNKVHFQNGLSVCSTAEVKMSSNSMTTVADRGGIQIAGGPDLLSEPSSLRFMDKRTRPIIKLIFLKLCLECAREFKNVQQEIDRLEKEEDKELVYLVAERMVGVIREWNVIRQNLEDLRNPNWNIYEGNMHSEFTKVAYQVFSETINWGRIIVFVGFSVSFATYLLEQDVRSAADSVLEWTRLMIEEDLAKYFISNGGWEGFADYLDVSLRAALKHRNRLPRSVQAQAQVMPDSQNSAARNGDGSGDNPGWSGALVAGAMAFGAVGLFALKNALS